MPQQANQLFRPRPSEQPLYPVPLLDNYEIRPGEIRYFGGFPFARTDDGLAIVEHVDLCGVIETDD